MRPLAWMLLLPTLPSKLVSDKELRAEIEVEAVDADFAGSESLL
jgi:hypothetical protein